MKRKNLKPRVFFNASVILSGLNSLSGGSGKLLALVKQKRISGIVSEITLDEILRHTEKLKLKKTSVEAFIFSLFSPIRPAPEHELVKKYARIVTDAGDAHVLASYYEINANFLVTLDKKHLLILQHKIKGINIVSPKELLEHLAKV